MQYLKYNKKKIVDKVLLTAFILFVIRVAFFLQDRTMAVVSNVLIHVILGLIAVIFGLTLIPNKKIKTYVIEQIVVIPVFIALVAYEIIYVVQNGLDFTGTSYLTVIGSFGLAVFLSITSLMIPKLKTLPTIKLQITKLLIATLLMFLIIQSVYQDHLMRLVDTILMDGIAILSIFIIGLILFPVHTSFRNFMKQNRPFIALAVLMAIYELVFLYKNNLEVTLVTYFSIAFAIGLTILIILALPMRLRSFWYVASLIVIPIYMVAQDIYFQIFQAFFSFKEIVTIKEGLESAEGVMNLHWIYAIYLTLLIGSLIYYFMIKKNTSLGKHIQFYKSKKKYGFILFVLFMVVNFNSSIPPKSARLHLSDHYLYYSVYSNPKFVGHFGGTNYLTRDFFGAIIPNRSNKKDIKEIEQYFEQNPKLHVDNSYTGLFEGKNLVFIIAESFDFMAVNPDLTPNIVKLMDEGINFENHYVPVYPRTTCDSEIIYNTGLIPSVNDGPTCYMFNQNTYSNSLANLFNQKGYLTQAFHSNYKEFYTRNLVYKGFGYDSTFGQHELDLSETDKRFDSIFFEKGKDAIIPESDGPFISTVLTLSGHSPYQKSSNLAINKHYDTVDAYYGDTIDHEVKAYIAAQIEVDLLVGKLLEDLTSKEMLEDTVIMFTTDHYPYTMSNDVYEKHTGISDEYQKMHSPLVIWGSGVEPQSITKLTASFDVLPTIANLFGLNADYRYYFGHDVFNDNYKPIVMYKDFSWFDGDNYVLYGKLKDGDADQRYVEETTALVDQYFKIGRKILRVDYYKDFNKDE
jgi:lipoteichoic acid synthase